MFKTGADDSWQDHTTELQSPVFDDPGEAFVVTKQPQAETSTNLEESERNYNDRGTRRQIPISTIDWESTNNMQVIATHGIDFLRGIDQLYILQTVELSDLMSNVQSENRYKVIIPHRETLFYASEQSSDRQRMFCGSNRGFVMNLFDQSQQQALYMKRSFTIGCCSIWCKLQKLEIYMPNEQYVGCIKQIFSLSIPTFALYNDHNSIIYRIEGPSSFMGALKEAHFGIYSNDGMTQLGSINHQWDQILNEYIISVTFPSRAECSKYKAIIMGAAFLLEYMYFFHTKKSGSICWC